MLAEQLKEIATQHLSHMPVAAEDLLRIAAEVHRVEVIARKVLEREAAGFAPFSAYPCGCAVEDEHDHTRQTRWCSFHAKMRNRLDELEARAGDYVHRSALESEEQRRFSAEQKLAQLEARERLNEKIAQAQRQPGIADLERLAELEAREQARLSARAYSHSPTGYGDLATRAGYGDLKTQGRWIGSGQDVDHQSLRDGDPPHIAEPEC